MTTMLAIQLPSISVIKNDDKRVYSLLYSASESLTLSSFFLVGNSTGPRSNCVGSISADKTDWHEIP